MRQADRRAKSEAFRVCVLCGENCVSSHAYLVKADSRLTPSAPRP